MSLETRSAPLAAAPPRQQARAITPRLMLGILAVLALAACAAFMVLGAKGQWSFILTFRGTKLAALLLVAYAVAVSTVLFQTVTNNRILTPSVMGFDSLYALIQTCLIVFLGSREVSSFDPQLRFLLEVTVMVVFSGFLFRWLFTGGERSIHLLVLVGIIFGIFFRSLSTFMQRVLDPNEFAVLQDMLFASFNTIDKTLLGLSAVIVLGVSLIGLRMLHTFDVLALGRANAINLGLNYRRTVSIILVLIAVLVSVSTALVGPVTFFGLLVVSLAHLLMGSGKHRYLLPASILLAIICLVGGQVILERIFAFDTALSIVIEFLGGIVFIILILRGAAR